MGDLAICQRGRFMSDNMRNGNGEYIISFSTFFPFANFLIGASPSMNWTRLCGWDAPLNDAQLKNAK
jgi:hypothetical protein